MCKQPKIGPAQNAPLAGGATLSPANERQIGFSGNRGDGEGEPQRQRRNQTNQNPRLELEL
jgi:hypothetical protein